MRTKKKVTKKTVVKRKKVAVVPRGYHSITPYLLVSNGIEAIKFYKKIFGAKEVMRFKGPKGKVGHAELQIGDSRVMLSDMGPSGKAAQPTIFVHLYIENVDKVVRKAVAAGAKLIQSVADKFYGDRSGMIEDPFGHQWGVSTHIENVSPKELSKRAKQAEHC